MKKDKEFFNLCINGDKQIIELLKNDKEIKNIKDSKGNSIYVYLIAGNQSALLSDLIEKKLLSYNQYKKDFNKIMLSNYINDKYINFLNILKETDKKKFLENNINNIIEGNNIKTISLIESEEINKNIHFNSLVKCNEDVLELIYDKVKNKLFTTEEIKLGFEKLKNNKIRSSILMNLISWQINPQLYEDLNKINNYCISFLENKDLYNKLEKNLEERKKVHNIKI